jgi:hypothetical protein
MHPTALDDVAAAEPGLVEQLAETRTAQKQLYTELLALRGRYQHAHRAYCAAYAAIRNHGVRERVLTDLDCPPLDPRFDPFLRDAFIGRGTHYA